MLDSEKSVKLEVILLILIILAIVIGAYFKNRIIFTIIPPFISCTYMLYRVFKKKE